jgi:aldehyde:ferredoxin oxidoreductase
MNGYGGSILRVNLKTGQIQKQPTPPDVARDFLGGRGFGIYFLTKEVPAKADPFGPENKMIISTGPFSGLLIPGGGKCDWTTKSPLTGGYASASMGGHFTAEMKYAGLDSIILEGISPKPVYLFIDDNKVELRDASHLWGKSSITVEKELKEQFGEEYQIATIGPAGENGVLFAHINHDYGRQAGRGGVGAVLGTKKVKAIVLHGTKSIPVADLQGYKQAGMDLFKACKEAEILKEWQSYGTTMVVSWCDEVGALPTRNFTAGSFELGKNLYAPVMRKTIVVTDKGCFGCPSPCGKYSHMRRYNTYVEGPEYETIGMLGSDLGLGNIEDVAQANLLCDDLGIDTISTGGVIAWAMECYEKGIFTKKDTDGLEQSAYATHNATAMLLAYMTCDVGAHHNRAWAITYDLQVGREKVVPEKVARVIWLQNFRPMFDVLGACRLQWVELSIDRNLYLPALEAITGIKRSWEDLETVGERIWNLTRLYWMREIDGFGREWDLPAPRFYEEPPKTGATAGQITRYEDVQKLLDYYYEQRGWSQNGTPTAETIARLNLEQFVN